MRRLGIIFLLLAVLTATEALCSEKADISRENRLLEAELKLARQSKIYAVFDLHHKNISVKIRGMELTNFPIEKVSVWGNPLPTTALSVLRKSSFVNPKRKEIDPGRNKADDNFELEALEVGDMPSRYVLYLDKGVSVCVRPGSTGIFSRLLDAGYYFTRVVTRSFYSTWSLLRKRPFTEADITLTKKDAQSLYWDIRRGTSCILGSP